MAEIFMDEQTLIELLQLLKHKTHGFDRNITTKPPLKLTFHPPSGHIFAEFNMNDIIGNNMIDKFGYACYAYNWCITHK